VSSGFFHSERFSILGVFSAGILSEPEPLEQALQSPEKIKANISYLYVTTGSHDPRPYNRSRHESVCRAIEQVEHPKATLTIQKRLWID
jgi:hypothetical protein